MKKLFALLAILAASSAVQAQTFGDRVAVGGDRAGLIQVADHGLGYRADRARMRHHRKHRRHYHR